MGGKHKRGERGSTDSEEPSSSKRVNMADTETQLDNASCSRSATNADEPTRSELKEMLIDIQINVNNILRDNIKLREEVMALRSTIQQQQEELTKLKPLVSGLQQELEDARRKIDEQEEEISQLYDLQNNLEQYTRKNSLEIHSIPESAFTTTEEAVLNVAEALEVEVRPQDIEISHHLEGEVGVKPIIRQPQNESCSLQAANKVETYHFVRRISRFDRCFAALLQRHFHKRKSDLIQTRAIKGGKQKT